MMFVRMESNVLGLESLLWGRHIRCNRRRRLGMVPQWQCGLQRLEVQRSDCDIATAVIPYMDE